MLFPHILASFSDHDDYGADVCVPLVQHRRFWPEIAVRSLKLLFTCMNTGDEGRKLPSGLWDTFIQILSRMSHRNVALDQEKCFSKSPRNWAALFF